MKLHFARSYESILFILGCTAGGFLVARSTVANTSGESSLGLTALFRLLATLPLVFAVLPRATNPQLSHELSRLVHLGLITA